MTRALTPSLIASIRELRSLGITVAALARTFALDRATIRKALQDA